MQMYTPHMILKWVCYIFELLLYTVYLLKNNNQLAYRLVEEVQKTFLWTVDNYFVTDKTKTKNPSDDWMYWELICLSWVK